MDPNADTYGMNVGRGEEEEGDEDIGREEKERKIEEEEEIDLKRRRV